MSLTLCAQQAKPWERPCIVLNTAELHSAPLLHNSLNFTAMYLYATTLNFTELHNVDLLNRSTMSFIALFSLVQYIVLGQARRLGYTALMTISNSLLVHTTTTKYVQT